MKSFIAGVIVGVYVLGFPLAISAPPHFSTEIIPQIEEKLILDEIGAKRWALETGLVEENSLAHKIIKCESGWDIKACYKGFSCKNGMGLFQFVASTWNETIVRMSKADVYMPGRCWQFISLPELEERSEAIFDGECNLLAGLWLLGKDGDVHWRDYSGTCYLK